MTLTKSLLPFSLLLIALSACSETGPDRRYVMPISRVTPADIKSTNYIIVRDITTPSYLKDDSILYGSNAGGLLEFDKAFWADDGDRAFKQAFAAALSKQTGIHTAAEPAPTSIIPIAFVDININELIADAEGNLILSGQYYITDYEVGTLRAAEYFSYSIPVEGPTAKDVANAHSKAVYRLAGDVGAVF